jgi:hypothetical protein
MPRFGAPRAKIRFVLDGLDMEAVAGKHTRQGYDRIAVPITLVRAALRLQELGKAQGTS